MLDFDLFLSTYVGRRSDRGTHYHNATFKEFIEIEKRLTNLEERQAWFEQRKAEKTARSEVFIPGFLPGTLPDGSSMLLFARFGSTSACRRAQTIERSFENKEKSGERRKLL